MAPKVTKIHLNGRVSERFMNYVDETYPNLVRRWHCFTDYSVLEVPGETPNEKLQEIITQVKNRYPLEIETIL